MRKKLTNTKNRIRAREKWARKFRVFVYIVVAIVAALVARVIWLEVDDARGQGSAEKVGPYGSLQDLLDPEVFRMAVLEANGGREYLDSLRSIRMNGRIQSGEHEFEFFILKRRPDQMLLTYKMPGQELSYGVSGETAWQRLLLPDGTEHQTQLDEEAARGFQQTANFFGPTLVWALTSDTTSISLRPSTWEGIECIQVSLESGQTLIFVDPLTLRPLAQLDVIPSIGTQESRFSGYSLSQGLVQPSITETYQGGGLTTRMEVDSLQFNVGAVNSLFVLP